MKQVFGRAMLFGSKFELDLENNYLENISEYILRFVLLVFEVAVFRTLLVCRRYLALSQQGSRRFMNSAQSWSCWARFGRFCWKGLEKVWNDLKRFGAIWKGSVITGSLEHCFWLHIWQPPSQKIRIWISSDDQIWHPQTLDVLQDFETLKTLVQTKIPVWRCMPCRRSCQCGYCDDFSLFKLFFESKKVIDPDWNLFTNLSLPDTLRRFQAAVVFLAKPSYFHSSPNLQSYQIVFLLAEITYNCLIFCGQNLSRYALTNAEI